ncbi:MAG: nitroreductase family protein [Planctomycetes bacterium]|nr:nitroreductase family protein [Planctomycetota bacterium]
MSDPRFVPLDFQRRPEPEMIARARAFDAEMQRRRSVRHFQDTPVPREVLELALRTAGSAPSGAHQQPWTFVVVTDPALKRRIREAAEAEERENYEHRMSDAWLEVLHPLGTNAEKPFLETAPALIAVFLQTVHVEAGRKVKHYYTQESVGIAVGFLLMALHHAGLASLTHTPSPMGFLEQILERPANERAFVLLPVGYPAEGCRVPDLVRKPLEEIAVWR